MSEQAKQYWMRMMRTKIGLVVSSNGVFSDKDECENCGEHKCYEVSEELALSVDQDDIKGRQARTVVGGKVTELSDDKPPIE